MFWSLAKIFFGVGNLGVLGGIFFGDLNFGDFAVVFLGCVGFWRICHFERSEKSTL